MSNQRPATAVLASPPGTAIVAGSLLQKYTQIYIHHCSSVCGQICNTYVLYIYIRSWDGRRRGRGGEDSTLTAAVHPNRSSFPSLFFKYNFFSTLSLPWIHEATHIALYWRSLITNIKTHTLTRNFYGLVYVWIYTSVFLPLNLILLSPSLKSFSPCVIHTYIPCIHLYACISYLYTYNTLLSTVYW